MIIYAIVLQHDESTMTLQKALHMDDLYEKIAKYFFDRYCSITRSSKHPITLKEHRCEDNFKNAGDIICSNCCCWFSVKYTTTDDYDEEEKEINIMNIEIQNKMNKLIDDNHNHVF